MKAQVEQDFKAKLMKLAPFYPNIPTLATHFNNGAFDFEALKIIGELLEKVDSKALALINSNIDKLVNVTTHSMHTSGIRWDDILLRFEWSFEADLIK